LYHDTTAIQCANIKLENQSRNLNTMTGKCAKTKCAKLNKRHRYIFLFDCFHTLRTKRRISCVKEEMDGISFIVRVRNEEATLEQSIRSLFKLQIPHEIVTILHCCTDSSQEIANKLQRENARVRVMIYEHPVSRAGYETLCTDASSPHSVTYYFTWCLQQARHAWHFKWDADFIATPELLTYLNNNSWTSMPYGVQVYINAKSEDSNNVEAYLFTGQVTCRKYWFWETLQINNTDIRKLYPQNVTVQHASKLKDVKSYWHDQPWFETPEAEADSAAIVKKRYNALIALMGHEPMAQARASNPVCDDLFTRLVGQRAVLEELDIHPTM
jgi:hypothetical protein